MGESMVCTDKAHGANLERIVEHFVQEGARAREHAAFERREMNERWGELARQDGYGGRGHRRTEYPPARA